MAAASNWERENFFGFLARQNRQAFFAYHLPSTQFMYYNPAFERLWGRTPGSIPSDPAYILDTIHPDDRNYIQTVYQEVLEGQEKQDVEFRILLPESNEKWVSITPYLTGKQNEDLTLVAFLEDITMRKENERNVRKFTARKNSLLEILSHDLSTPLVNIQGLAALLRVQLKYRETKQLDEIINLLEENARRNVQLIRTFVEQETLETTRTALFKERTDIIQKTRYALEQFKASEDILDKTFHFFSFSDTLYLDVDESKFLLIISNLVSNSIKFTHDGGVITVRLEEKEESVLLTITDDGIGIPAALQPFLFDRFTKAKRHGIRGEESIGLGLSLTKSIVDLHDGKIWFESEENKGTTFFVELPK